MAAHPKCWAAAQCPHIQSTLLIIAQTKTSPPKLNEYGTLIRNVPGRHRTLGAHTHWTRRRCRLQLKLTLFCELEVYGHPVTATGSAGGPLSGRTGPGRPRAVVTQSDAQSQLAGQ